MAAVEFITLLEEAGENYDDFVNFYFFKLMQYAQSIKNIAVVVPPAEGRSKLENGKRLVEFILRFPESGTTPQLVVAKLLKAALEQDGKEVCGDDESVFGTNTTSKKPADIWTVAGEDILNLYEVTVKKIDCKRLDDAIEHVAAIGVADKPLTFICRLPTDVNGLEGCVLHGSSATFEYRGKQIEFIDIEAFMKALCGLLSETELALLIEEIAEFIESIERPVATKSGWNEIFSD